MASEREEHVQQALVTQDFSLFLLEGHTLPRAVVLYKFSPQVNSFYDTIPKVTS